MSAAPFSTPKKKETISSHPLMNKRIKRLVYLYNEILLQVKRKEISRIVMTCMAMEIKYCMMALIWAPGTVNTQHQERE